ncbi:hypothetical protein SAMN05444671_4218 [Flavobacterium sp. CF108]|uniref:hypothetical protein n=1 Tax=unclassified Flavobacterium TaxID=196869 RepID=UPI0008D0E570|nr:MULTISPECIES: hypothetical protein [unclassified Flavobacterium]SEO70244.1 hypothetical protein SAMN04487978_3472 [Flavobacterium sp. fv08]SHH90837.1 hypothetical protein SAMN05444671_4218 [Flavobacterium sp. CF108]
MNFEGNENDETTFRKQESFCLYDSITICGDQEISRYFRGQSNKASWDDEDDSLEDEDDNYYDDEEETLESYDRPL